MVMVIGIVAARRRRRRRRCSDVLPPALLVVMVLMMTAKGVETVRKGRVHIMDKIPFPMSSGASSYEQMSATEPVNERAVRSKQRSKRAIERANDPVASTLCVYNLRRYLG